MSLWSKLLLNPSIPADRAWVIVLFTKVSSLCLRYKGCGKRRSRWAHHGGGDDFCWPQCAQLAFSALEVGTGTY